MHGPGASVSALEMGTSYSIAHEARRRSSGSVSEDGNCFFVSSLTYFDDMVWTGTSDGYVILYSVGRNAKRNAPKYSLKKYPTGCRLSPEGACGVVNRSQMCYIPTDEEARGEEIMSLAEGVRRPSRVSISIDVGTQQYIVCRKSLERKEEGSHECDGLDICSGHDGCLKRRKDALIGKIPERPPLSLQRFSSCSSRDHCAPSYDHNAFSINSDTSAFTIESTGSRKKLSRRIRETKRINPARSPIASSSNVSMEYDDLFEMYSDEDYNQVYVQNPITAISTTTKLGMWSECSCSCVNPLRRKDLEFDDPVVLAIPESLKEKHKIASPSSDRNDSILHEEFQEVNSSFGLTVVMKLKIADKPVKKMATTRIGDDDMLLTCAGSFSEEESLLLWRKEPISGLWINDPIPPLPVRDQT
ncbi:unnamed protein product [Haemonchus placei]|uniref:WD_REPEATS_REGION domain-containing protein n=1 Tax=Haemonchus placei TaxID=6290 RepID=A0A158QMI2_HAEPC|nr:unnamed protein product [Haemonchus placei]